MWHRIGRCAWAHAGEMSELGAKSGDGRERKLKTILCAGTRCRVGDTFEMMIRPSSNTAFTAGTETRTCDSAKASLGATMRKRKHGVQFQR